MSQTRSVAQKAAIQTGEGFVKTTLFI